MGFVLVDSYRCSLQTLTDLLVQCQESARCLRRRAKEEKTRDFSSAMVAVVGGDIDPDSAKEMTELAKNGKIQPRHWHSEGPGRRHR